ncbi:MAG: hypothetical protein QXX11_04935 [Thermoplasmata archaeon]
MIGQKTYFGKEEIIILGEFDKDNYKILNGPQQQKDIIKIGAKNFLHKNKKLSIRGSKQVLLKLKGKSYEKCISYQTLILSILHKFDQDNNNIGAQNLIRMI